LVSRRVLESLDDRVVAAMIFMAQAFP